MKCCLTGSAVDGENMFAVAIRKFLPDQLHMGIYCKSEKDESIIHLLGNFRVDKSVSFDKYNYLQFIQLEDEEDVIHMISVAEAIHATKPCEVAYAPCGGGGFDVTGSYHGDVGDGLTCASFVLKLIESQGYELIDTNDWPIRDSDCKWQQEALWGLADEAMTEEDHEHIDIQTQKLEEGAPRFRPEEVGASVTLEGAPNRFCSIQPVSLKLIELL